MDLREYAQVVEFEDVPTDKIEQVKDKFFDVLRNICQQGVDFERMKTMIRRHKVKHFNSIENSPHGEFSMAFIANFLYSNNDTDLLTMLDAVKLLDELESRGNRFWTDLIKKYLLETAHVCILSSPSEELAEQLEKEEKERIEKRKQELGDEKLKSFVEDLKIAEQVSHVHASFRLKLGTEKFCCYSRRSVEQVYCS